MRKCVSCSTPAVEGRVRCERHQQLARERSRAWRAANPDARRAQGLKWQRGARDGEVKRCVHCVRPAVPGLSRCEEHLAKSREDSRKRWRSGRAAENKRRWRAANKEVAHYGLSREDFERLLAKQGHRCGLCGAPRSAQKRDFAIDHDHRFERGDPRGVRGAVCIKCNTAIGLLGDNLLGVRRALEYLERFEATVRPRLVRAG